MGFFKNLIFEADAKPDTVATQPVVQQSTVALNVQSSASADSVVDHDSLQQQLMSMVAGHPQFEIFKKLEDGLDRLKNIPGMTEQMRWKAAAAGIDGATKEALMTALGTVHDTLVTCQTGFNQQFIQPLEVAGANAKAEIENLDKEIEELNTKLAALAGAKQAQADVVEKSDASRRKALVDFSDIAGHIEARYKELEAKVTAHV